MPVVILRLHSDCHSVTWQIKWKTAMSDHEIIKVPICDIVSGMSGCVLNCIMIFYYRLCSPDEETVSVSLSRCLTVSNLFIFWFLSDVHLTSFWPNVWPVLTNWPVFSWICHNDGAKQVKFTAFTFLWWLYKGYTVQNLEQKFGKHWKLMLCIPR